MSKKNAAKIDMIKAIAGVSFATLAAIGGATGNPLIAGLSVIPSAGLASSEAIGDQMQVIKSKLQKENYLELPSPPWWTHDTRSWQNLCAEIGNSLPQILEIMRERMQQERQALTKETVRQIFIDALTNQHLTWEYDSGQKRRVGEFVSAPILEKLDQVLQPVIEHLQHEGTLIDSRRTARHTEQTVCVLEKIHEELSNTSKSPTLSNEEVAAIRKQYCNALYKRWKMLDFKGILHVDMNRPISIPLTEVFIFPDVLIGIPEHETLERDGEHLLPGSHPLQRAKRITPQRETLHVALAKHRQLVLLGNPGSGKSTLLRYLLLLLVQGSDTFATTFPQMADVATATPLYIPLATYAEALLSNVPGTRSFEDFLPIYLRDTYLGTCIDFIRAQLHQGNLFLLLDGLDEIPDTALRMNVVRHIEMFTQTYAVNRFVVTSQIVGYKAAPLSSEYQPYTLADFNEEQIKDFTQKWCPAYEYWVHDARDSHYLEEAATKEAEKLFSATQSKPGVKRLAINPLLLTILALIQRQGIELPSHRVELFELCALTLIDTWIKAKGQSIHFSKNDIIKILRPLAFWMHEHPAVGAIPEEELQEQIVRQLTGRTINEYEATKMAEQFLQTVRGKTGILVERGKDRYGFLHLTFEEYFAARELEKRRDKHSFIRAHLHDPRWREVILLTVGAIGILQSNEEEVTELVQHTIAKAASLYESSLHRDLLFAGLCLADDVGVTIACENEIIEQIVYLYLTSPYDKLRDSFSNVITEWSDIRVAEKAIGLVFPILHQWVASTDSKRTFSATSPFEKLLAEHIEQLATQYQKAMMKRLHFHITILLARLQALDEIDWRKNLAGILSEDTVKERMMSLFEQCIERQQCITDALLLALSDPDHNVRWHVIMALGQLGVTQSRVIDALLATVSDSNFEVRKVALDVLGRLGNTQTYVIDALLEVFVDWYSNKQTAVRALGQVGQEQPRVINVLLKALTDIDASTTRLAAARALARTSKGQPHIVDALLITLSDTDEDVREAVADTLSQLCKRKNHGAINALLSAITDPDANTVELTAHALGQLSNNPPYITDTLQLAFPDANVAREAAANALGLFSERQPQIINELLTTLAESSLWQVKKEAIKALRRLGEKEPRITNALLTALIESSSWKFKREVIRALGALSDGEPHVIDALLNTLTDPSSAVRRATIEALKQVGKRDPHILNALLTILANSRIKEEAISTLEQLSNGEPEIIDALLVTVTDSRLSFQEKALQALGHLASTQPKIVGHLVTALQKDDITCNATESYRERVCATFVRRALGILRSVSVYQFFIIDPVFSLLSNSTSDISIEAAITLGQLGKKEPSIIHRLLPLLSDPDENVRKAVTWAFGSSGVNQSQVFDALLLALSDSEATVRRTAATVMWRGSRGQPQVINGLLHALFDTDSQVRGEAAFALGQVGKSQPQVIDALLQALLDSRGSVRGRAASALQSLKTGQAHVIEALLQSLFGPSASARHSAALAIGRLWNGQMNILDTLLAHLMSSDLSTRVSSIRAFINIVSRQHEIINTLLPNLTNSSRLVREATAEVLALRNLNGDQSNVVTALLLTLSDPSPRVRAATARALQIPEGAYIDEIPSIVEALLLATYDPDWSVRESAASALSTLQQQNAIIGERLEQLLQQYECIAHRDLRGYSPLFNTLQEIAKK